MARGGKGVVHQASVWEGREVLIRRAVCRRMGEDWKAKPAATRFMNCCLRGWAVGKGTQALERTTRRKGLRSSASKQCPNIRPSECVLTAPRPSGPPFQPPPGTPFLHTAPNRTCVLVMSSLNVSRNRNVCSSDALTRV
jgi:hypothetical protein